MYVVEVVPIGRGVHVSSLSYFSSNAFGRGSIVRVPLRKKTVSGIVIGIEEVSRVKTALRAATFSLKRLPEQTETQKIAGSLLRTVDALADYYAAQPGAVLFALLQNDIIRGAVPLPQYDTEPVSLPITPEILQAETSERYRIYKGTVRQAFANRSSVVIIAPTPGEVTYLRDSFKKGIEQHVVTLTSTMSAGARAQAFQKLENLEHPILFIATPQYATTDRPDVSTVIIEHSRSSLYESQTRPYINFAHALEVHAQSCGRRIVSGDTLIQTEDSHRLATESAQPFETTLGRLSLSGTLVHTFVPHISDGASFSLFENKLLERLQSVVERKERAFLFAARRGLAPVVACVDCGHLFRDPESGAPLSLHRKPSPKGEERWLVSSVSGHKQKAPDTCPSCGGWRLKERGIGIQHVYDEITKYIDPKQVILFDQTTATTAAKARRLAEKFYTEKGVVLLGGSMALPHLHKTVDMSVVVSLEGLRAIPSWKQQEEVLGTLLALRERTHGTVYVQERAEETDDIFTYAEKGNVKGFYEEELHVRESLGYPPFSVFIHLSWIQPQDTEDALGKEIEEMFKAQNIAIYGPPIQKGKRIRYGLMRIKKESWPQKEVAEKLRALPPSVKVAINPRRVI